MEKKLHFTIIGSGAGGQTMGADVRIDNCSVTGGTISASSGMHVYAGGLAARLGGTNYVTNCYADIDITAASSKYVASAGGLVELLGSDLVGGFGSGLIAGGDGLTGCADGGLQAGLDGHVTLVRLLIGEHALLLRLNVCHVFSKRRLL